MVTVNIHMHPPRIHTLLALPQEADASHGSRCSVRLRLWPICCGAEQGGIVHHLTAALLGDDLGSGC